MASPARRGMFDGHAIYPVTADQRRPQVCENAAFVAVDQGNERIHRRCADEVIALAFMATGTGSSGKYDCHTNRLFPWSVWTSINPLS